jgi:hypothetical protein
MDVITIKAVPGSYFLFSEYNRKLGHSSNEESIIYLARNLVVSSFILTYINEKLDTIHQNVYNNITMYSQALSSTFQHSPAYSSTSFVQIVFLFSYVNYKYVDLIKNTSLLTGVLCDTYDGK